MRLEQHIGYREVLEQFISDRNYGSHSYYFKYSRFNGELMDKSEVIHKVSLSEQEQNAYIIVSFDVSQLLAKKLLYILLKDVLTN